MDARGQARAKVQAEGEDAEDGEFEASFPARVDMVHQRKSPKGERHQHKSSRVDGPRTERPDEIERKSHGWNRDQDYHNTLPAGPHQTLRLAKNITQDLQMIEGPKKLRKKERKKKEEEEERRKKGISTAFHLTCGTKIEVPKKLTS